MPAALARSGGSGGLKGLHATGKGALKLSATSASFLATLDEDLKATAADDDAIHIDEATAAGPVGGRGGRRA